MCAVSAYWGHFSAKTPKYQQTARIRSKIGVHSVVANHGRLGISRGKHTERLCEACVQINQTHEYGASKLNRKCLLTHLREPAASQRMEAPVKALYAALALFFVAAPTASSARSPDLSLSPPLCSDDYYEDTAGQCGAVSAGEVLTIEAILAKYGHRCRWRGNSSLLRRVG